jgi:hypothetical protein
VLSDIQKVRRFQCCFSKPDDFDVAINFLSSVGWPVIDAAVSKSRQDILQSRTGIEEIGAIHRRQDVNGENPTDMYHGKQSTRELTAMASSSSQYASHQSLPTQHDRFSQNSARVISNKDFQTPPHSSSQLQFVAEPQDAPSRYDIPSLADVSRLRNTRPLTAPSEVNTFHGPSISSKLDQLQTSVNDLSPLPQPTFLTPTRSSDTPKNIQRRPPLVAENPYLQRPQSSRDSVLPQKRSHRAFRESENRLIEQSPPIAPQPMRLSRSNTQRTMSSQLGPARIDPDADLEAYAALPHTQRSESLDNWILAKLNDESFLQLLEDMQQAWRRIGLNRY